MTRGKFFDKLTFPHDKLMFPHGELLNNVYRKVRGCVSAQIFAKVCTLKTDIDRVLWQAADSILDQTRSRRRMRNPRA